MLETLTFERYNHAIIRFSCHKVPRVTVSNNLSCSHVIWEETTGHYPQLRIRQLIQELDLLEIPTKRTNLLTTR